MKYSIGFKARMVQRMTGPEGISGMALHRETGVGDSTLSRWKQQAGTILAMAKDTRFETPKLSPHHRSAEEKLRLVMKAAELSDAELGAFLRKEGIHASHLVAWRKDMLEALGSPTRARRPARKTSGNAKKVKALEKELRRKEKALAETAALLVLKKKVDALWGDEGDDT